ncbi:MAG: hypothetical protein LBP82_00550 [Candidatus Methanoplasma sp.]|jgi:RNA-binding protein|nr:hypothetical protein [Candidatus Methanoplasma sp.]
MYLLLYIKESLLGRDKDMEFLGIIDRAAGDDKIIVIGTADVPDLGSPVFDSGKNKIGTVKRVFGPVNEPFITVAVEDAAALRGLRNKELYTTRRTQNGKDKRRNRRD